MFCVLQQKSRDSLNTATVVLPRPSVLRREEAGSSSGEVDVSTPSEIRTPREEPIIAEADSRALYVHRGCGTRAAYATTPIPNIELRESGLALVAVTTETR